MRVRADAEALLHLALDGLARRQHRLEAQAGHGLERIQALRGEQAAGGHFHAAVDAPQRQQFFLQQDPRGKQREELPVRLDVVQRRVSEVVFLRQPAQHVLLRLAEASALRTGFAAANIAASVEDSCLAATILSSNGFNDASWAAISLMLVADYSW